MKVESRTTKVNLTLNGSTREVEAWQPGHDDTLRMPGAFVYGIDIKTAGGNKLHSGWIELRIKEGKTDYSVEDVRDCGYSGMRGNGHANRSQVRYIGFPKPQ